VDDPSVAPFKTMYTAFDKRRPDLEASAPDGGVPSGGGWHQIGDNAETILNSLEPDPIVTGYTQGNPLPGGPPSGAFSYGLDDVATIRWLQPGEALVVPRGPSSQPNYHWYFMNADHPVTTEEWVHPWAPPAGTLDFGSGPSP
jgi:hypothetical protein